MFNTNKILYSPTTPPIQDQVPAAKQEHICVTTIFTGKILKVPTPWSIKLTAQNILQKRLPLNEICPGVELSPIL